MKNFYYFLIFILLYSCNFQKIEELHGISNLFIKVNQIKINETNKNDIEKIIGPALVIDHFNKNIWSYYEIRTEKNLIGQKKIILNDVLILKFNSTDIVIAYIKLNKHNINNLDFDKNITSSNALDKSFLENVLQTTKKRIRQANKKLQ